VVDKILWSEQSGRDNVKTISIGLEESMKEALGVWGHKEPNLQVEGVRICRNCPFS
jgi:hypothetical protein